LEYLDDISNKSQESEEKDSYQLLSDSPKDSFTKKSQTLNVLIPEAFRHVLPVDVGDEIEIAIGNIYGWQRYTKSYEEFHMVLKAKIVGSITRMPGLFGMSGYAPAAFMSPALVISER
jgi:hypothetical protein